MRLDFDDLPCLEEGCRWCAGRGTTKDTVDPAPCSRCRGVGLHPTEFGRAVLDLVTRHLPTAPPEPPDVPTLDPRVAVTPPPATPAPEAVVETPPLGHGLCTRAGVAAEIQAHLPFRDAILGVGTVGAQRHAAVWHGRRCLSRPDGAWDLVSLLPPPEEPR